MYVGSTIFYLVVRFIQSCKISNGPPGIKFRKHYWILQYELKLNVRFVLIHQLLSAFANDGLGIYYFYTNSKINMKIASVNEIKQELNGMPASEVKELCLRLARFKKENKELLTYLLFEAHNEHGYVESIKQEIDEAFESLPNSNLHLTKKSLRKIVRSLNKYGRHTGTSQSQVEMLIHFCMRLKVSEIPIQRSPALENLYYQQLKKVNKLLDGIHEDLRFDFAKQLKLLEDIETPGSRFLNWFKKKVK